MRRSTHTVEVLESEWTGFFRRMILLLGLNRSLTTPESAWIICGRRWKIRTCTDTQFFTVHWNLRSVICRKARQIFLSDEHQRDKFMNNIEKCGRYHGAPVCALLWEHSILYQFRHILRRDQAQRLEFAIQGDPLELSRMRAAVQLITLING